MLDDLRHWWRHRNDPRPDGPGDVVVKTVRAESAIASLDIIGSHLAHGWELIESGPAHMPGRPHGRLLTFEKPLSDIDTTTIRRA